MTITNKEDDSVKKYQISQTGTGFVNNVSYYAVEIDGVKHYIVFENKKDESNAILIKQKNHASDFKDVVGDIIYKMNRNSFPTQ